MESGKGQPVSPNRLSQETGTPDGGPSEGSPVQVWSPPGVEGVSTANSPSLPDGRPQSTPSLFTL